jgi:tRNA threonylcarbamoyladenosine modification (KEOPS) complex  Pcc1 subunit
LYEMYEISLEYYMISGESITGDQARVLYDIRRSYFIRSVVNILRDQARILCEIRANSPRGIASILHEIGRE